MNKHKVILGVAAVCLLALSAGIFLPAKPVSAARSPVILTPLSAFTPTYGGMGTSTWQTKAIPFFNGTNFTESIAQLIWDNTNSMLGVGSTTPMAKLTVQPATTGSTTPMFVVWNTGSSTPAVYVGSPNENGRIGIGTTSPTTQLQVTAQTLNSTTSIEVGKSNQNKGSCLVLYDAAGTVQYVSIVGGAFAISTTSCK